MAIFTDPFRRLLRHFLGFQTRLAINKHKIDVIGIIDFIHPNQTRDYIYKILKDSNYPCRKNLEETTAEFSIPLSVLGYNYYPNNIIEWLKLSIRIVLGYFTIKPYKHTVVIDLHFINENLIKYWIAQINPNMIFVSSEFKIDNLDIETKSSLVIEIPNRTGEFDLQIQDFLFNSLQSKYNNLVKPIDKDINPKYRILRGKNGQIVIDSRYHFYPYNLDSIIEVAGALGAKTLVINNTNITKDFGSSQNILIMQYRDLVKQKLNFIEYDVIVFYGKFETMSELINELVANPLEV